MAELGIERPAEGAPARPNLTLFDSDVHDFDKPGWKFTAE